MIFDVPTKEEYKNLLNAYPFDESIISIEDFQYTIYPEDDFERFHAINQIETWVTHLQNRMYQTRFSWVALNHLFNKGIPDNEWFISPGRQGQTAEYFPHFEREHHRIKAQFDYFSDVFYYKLFSAWDNFGHILNNMYGLEIDRADFYKAVKKLKHIRPTLYSNLNTLLESEDFKKMKAFRHSSTHNELLGKVGPMTKKFSTSTTTGVTFGIGDYITSSQIKENADKSLATLTKAVEFIKEQVQSDIA